VPIKLRKKSAEGARRETLEMKAESSGKFSATAQVGRDGKGLKEERRDEERQ